MSSQIKIHRLGWREAFGMIRDEGYTLTKFDDGHAEVVSPDVTVVYPGLFLLPLEKQEGGEAEGYLTARSVEILERVMRTQAGEGADHAPATKEN